MNGWKKVIQDALSEAYPGTEIKWSENEDFTLVVPDQFEKQTEEIMDFLTQAWMLLDGEVKFYPEQAIKS